MKYTETLSWILDKKGKVSNEEEKYQQNIDFVHSLGKQCDCVGWSELDCNDPDFDLILDKIDKFCKSDGWTARCCYERNYADLESNWFELLTTDFNESAIANYITAPTVNGEEIDLITLKAYKETLVSPKEFFGICVPERMRNSIIKHSVENVDFSWIQDKGKFAAEQYFYIYPQKSVSQIFTDENVCEGSKERLASLGGKLPRITEVFQNIQSVSLPDCYHTKDLPDGGIAVAFAPATDTFSGRNTLLIHKSTAEKLLADKVISPKYLNAVAVVKDTPKGYSVTVTKNQNKPTQEYCEHTLLKYGMLKNSSRPAYTVTQKDALKAMKKAKSLRKKDFAKKLNCSDVDSPLTDYYLVADGGLLSDEYTLLSFKESQKATEEFYKSLEKEELLQTVPQGAVFCNCTNGDKVLLLNNETVVRFSHEEPEALTVWENIHQFIYEAITDNY